MKILEGEYNLYVFLESAPVSIKHYYYRERERVYILSYIDRVSRHRARRVPASSGLSVETEVQKASVHTDARSAFNVEFSHFKSNFASICPISYTELSMHGRHSILTPLPRNQFYLHTSQEKMASIEKEETKLDNVNWVCLRSRIRVHVIFTSQGFVTSYLYTITDVRYRVKMGARVFLYLHFYTCSSKF